MAGAEKGPSGPGLPAPPSWFRAASHTPRVTSPSCFIWVPGDLERLVASAQRGPAQASQGFALQLPITQVTSPVWQNAPREADPPLVFQPSGRLPAATSTYAAVNRNKRQALGTCGMPTLWYSILKFI